MSDSSSDEALAIDALVTGAILADVCDPEVTQVSLLHFICA